MHYPVSISRLHCQSYATLHVVRCRIILIQPHGNTHGEEVLGLCIQGYGSTESFYGFLIIFPDVHIPICLITQHISHSSGILQGFGKSYATVNGSHTLSVLFQPMPIPGLQLVGEQVLRCVVAKSIIIGSRQYQGIFRHRVFPLTVHIGIQPSIQQPLFTRELRGFLHLRQQNINTVHIHSYLFFCQIQQTHIVHLPAGNEAQQCKQQSQER